MLEYFLNPRLQFLDPCINRWHMYLQFDAVFTDLDGKEKLCKLMDHALGGNYPLESAWKVIEEVDGLMLCE